MGIKGLEIRGLRLRARGWELTQPFEKLLVLLFRPVGGFDLGMRGLGIRGLDAQSFARN